MGLKIEGGYGIQRKLEEGCGMRDEIILLGPGYAVFNGRDAGCFEFYGGIVLRLNLTFILLTQLFFVNIFISCFWLISLSP